MAKLIFLAMSAVTTLLWILSKGSIDVLWATPATTLAQFAGLIGITALAWNFFLAARFRFVDAMFGGLDKVFKEHSRSGKIAFTLMLAHPILLIVEALPSWDLVRLYLLPGQFWMLNWGIFALWGFVVLIVLTLFVKLPYHIWKQTHRFMGLPFALVALHVANIQSDVAVYLPLRYWILGIAIASLVLYVYKVFLYRFVGPKHAYIAEAVRILGDIIEIRLKPKGKAMTFLPGQFVFISVDNKRVGKEEHPFTISSSPDEAELRLSIKKSGDWTARLDAIKKGDEIAVWGPYGKFGEQYLATDDKSVWIAGGIGVTPFLSMLLYSDHKQLKKDVAFFYATKNVGEAVYKNEVSEVTKNLPDVHVLDHYSDQQGYLTAEVIAQQVKDVKDRRIFICGPPLMMQSLRDGLMKQGVPRRKIIFEEFSFR